MRILIVGGTGLISSQLAGLAAGRGDDVALVNRGISTVAAPPAGTHIIHADATDASAMRAALRGPRLRGERFDAVVQFIAFEPSHVKADVETFAKLTDQYVLIATSAAYKTFDHFHALTETTELENRFWQYAQLKIECERALQEAAGAAGLGWTIVRPAHTYGPSRIPAYTGNSAHPWTVVDRMRRGASIVIPGDGTSLWTVTHSRDVAAGVLGLLGNKAALGQAVHVTSDEALTWLGLYGAIAAAAGLTAEQFASQCVFVPTEAIVAANPGQEGSLRGDKMHPAVYDTSKIKSLVPGWEAGIRFADGVREAIAWFEADPGRQSVDDAANTMFDKLADIYERALREAST
ncbi:MAG: NAD-dependent dehydratase [Actinobacteria bacterium HGW-Actinobacteria-4]|nr:MAG: NAD-dependent dehydratase [Actinobacteria bacterium HGW-Actinobacteria-4]